ncbi:hypothetical protein ACQKJ1_21155 [Methylorubrum rhodesianum]|uniref:hypothetical protein n=1 Tax=Methylorubrum rhodesianum TaxID=29427 RepID=UPI003D083CBF
MEWELFPFVEGIDWASLVGPAVVAAVVSGIVTTIGFLVNRSTTLETHREKLLADQRLAERKVEADITLARAKFDYDREQSIFKRKFDLAELMLTDAYRFQSFMQYVRNGFAFEGEAKDRPQEEAEPESLRRTRDSYYVPQARIKAEDEFLGSMFARRNACQAHFGVDADKAFNLFRQALHRTRLASQLLVGWSGHHGDFDKETMKNLRDEIWQQQAVHNKNDEIGESIEEAVKICERLCQPVLGSKASI